jgi:hypothetical protein
VGKVVQLLQSINYHNSRAHGHEQHRPFTQLVGFGWVGSIRFESSQFGLWYEACLHGLAIGGMPVSVGRFWL